MRSAPPNRQVLIVDPERDNRELLAVVVSGWGFWPWVAGSAQDALGLALEWRPELVISELVLGDLAPEHLLDALRPGGTTDRPVFIALTSRCRPEDRLWASRIGFDHFLPKPADLPALRGLLVRSLAQPSPAPSRSSPPANRPTISRLPCSATRCR